MSVPCNFSQGNRSTLCAWQHFPMATEALSVPGNFSWGNRSTVCARQRLSGQQKHCLCPATSLRATEALSVPSNVSQGNRSTVCPATSLRATEALLGVVIISFSFTWDQTPGNIPDPILQGCTHLIAYTVQPLFKISLDRIAAKSILKEGCFLFLGGEFLDRGETTLKPVLF